MTSSNSWDSPQPRRGWFKRHPVLTTMLFSVGAFGLGVVSGSEEEAEPAKARTVVETETLTEQVEVASEECLDALESADELNRISAEAITAASELQTINSEAWNIVSNAFSSSYPDLFASDLERLVPRIEEQGNVFTVLTPQLEVAARDYLFYSEQCRSG